MNQQRRTLRLEGKWVQFKIERMDGDALNQDWAITGFDGYRKACLVKLGARPIRTLEDFTDSALLDYWRAGPV